MSSILDTISKPEDGPIIATICAESGRGKSLLGASLPNVIFLQVEDTAWPKAMPKEARPDTFGRLKTVQSVMDALTSLAKEEHSYANVVIDSVTQFEQLCAEEIMRNEPTAASLVECCGGYGKAYAAIGKNHARIRRAADALKAKNINTWFLAHTEITKIDPPDCEPYTKYDIALHQKWSLPHYTKNVDLVGFMRLKTFVIGKDNEKKKAVSDGTIVIDCVASAATCAKNRYGITEPLLVPMNDNFIVTNPLIPFIPALQEPLK